MKKPTWTRTPLWMGSAAALVLGVAAGLLLVRGPLDDGNPSATPRVKGIFETRTPAPSPEATPTLEMRTAPPSAPEAAAPTPLPTLLPQTTPAPPTPIAPATRPATIDCQRADQEPFCSPSAGAARITDGLLAALTSGTKAVGPNAEATTPTFTMDAVALAADGSSIGPSDAVTAVRITIEIVNDTDTTFFFPSGEITLEVTRDGAPHMAPSFADGPFVMEPGAVDGTRATLAATFVVPVTGDGFYEWRGVTFFHT